MTDDVPPAKSKTSRKPPQLKAVPQAPVEAEPQEGEAKNAVLRKKELVDRVAGIAKARKKDLREVVEATLMVLGEALARGEDLNLPPLGRAKVGRQKGVNGGDLYVIKLRRDTGKDKGADASEGDSDG